MPKPDVLELGMVRQLALQLGSTRETSREAPKLDRVFDDYYLLYRLTPALDRACSGQFD